MRAKFLSQAADEAWILRFFLASKEFEDYKE
jgi:hypothetical protein